MAAKAREKARTPARRAARRRSGGAPARERSGAGWRSDRRCREFVAIAARLIVEEGVEAVRMTRVADQAGCARPLIYHYFPARSDLFRAIVEANAVEQPELLDERAVAHAMRSLGDPAAVDAEAAGFFERLVRALRIEEADDVARAGMILRASLFANRELHAQLAPIFESSDAPWQRPLIEIGLSEREARVVTESAHALLAQVLLEDEGDRREAIATGLRALSHMARGFLADARQAGRR